MERVFPRKFLKYSGKSLREKGITGEPDYYVRNGTKVFLFESKDVLLNKEIKQSNDFHQIEQGLKEKFYEYKKNGEIRKLGVFQLIENVKRVLLDENDFDKPNLNTVRIYPILIVYHNVFNTPGINGLVNYWFKSELKNLEKEGVKTNSVHDLVIIDFNIFILYHELFKSSRLRLEQLLEDYISITRKIEPPLSSKPLRERFFDSIVSFSMFVSNIVDKQGFGKSLGIFYELGLTLVEEKSN
jgi:hypothetical protein